MSDNNFPATITLAICHHYVDSLKCSKCLDEKLSNKKKENDAPIAYHFCSLNCRVCLDDKLSQKQKEQKHGHNGGNVFITTKSSEPSYLEIAGLPSSLPATYYEKPKMSFSYLSPSAYPVETKVCSHCSQPVQSVRYDWGSYM